MRGPKRKRLILFFLIAILLPAAVLIVLARQLIRQETELANSRAADERRNAVGQLRRELSARLDAITLQEINRRIRAPGTANADRGVDPSIVLVTTFDDNRMILPWESAQHRAIPGAVFANARQQGENVEFRNIDLVGAINAYQQALAAAGTLPEKCEARLLVGRVLLKASRMDEASRMYRAMMQDCGDVVDDFGIRFRLYAAERLISAFKDSSAANAHLVAIANSDEWIPPQEAYLVRSLLSLDAEGSAQNARNNISEQLRRSQQLVALGKDFPRIQALANMGWVAFGDEPWLVSIAPHPGQASPLIFVVSPRQLIPPLTALVSRETEGSVPLGEGFSGLRVEWLPGRFTPVRRVPASLYIAALALIIGTTILGGYLLLRDVNRDLRTSELRTHFVASVSHELKTPLTAVRMFAETLILGRVPDERIRSEYLATIMNESERLTRLVDNVLDFSKIEQGKKVYHMRTTVLPDVVRSAARTMQYPLAQLGFTLHVLIDESLPSLEADKDALEQAILNLLSNAMKYSGNPAEIELRLLSVKGEAVIEVADHGIGISPDDQPRVFEKFYRVRSPQTDSIGGTGLGLTLVKHIAEAHGGRVEVSSTLKKGSTFSIRLPLRKPEAYA